MSLQTMAEDEAMRERFVFPELSCYVLPYFLVHVGCVSFSLSLSVALRLLNW
uniref:Uncharacterized protein n=1 Tax=Anguilla anguilla TaxID=7936 RepID=A0A0E9PYT2_ANGAN